MSDMDNNIWKARSDTAIIVNIGSFIRHHRLKQNKSQGQLAEEAGIHRTTLVEFEKGTRANILTFIQLLRALVLLHILEVFSEQYQISPLHLAKLQHSKRERASKKKSLKVKIKLK